MPRKNLKGYIFSETIVDWILCCCVGIVSDFSVFCITSFGEHNICNTKTNTNLSLPKHTILQKRTQCFVLFSKRPESFSRATARTVTTRIQEPR